MKSLAELQAIRDKMQANLGLRHDEEDKTRIVVGMATCGIAAGARPVLSAFVDLIDKNNLTNVTVTQAGCIGICQYEPIVEVTIAGEEKVTYINMDADKAKEVFEQHVQRGLPIAKYALNTVMDK